ncbi:MAG: hypothetical protein JNM63_11260 [Spirochaetia bacterium]|nr:hypothetical protein [Spirochaetia bacterium]
MKKIKKLVLISAILLASPGSQAWAWVFPKDGTPGSLLTTNRVFQEARFSYRHFFQIWKFQPMIELEGNLQPDPNNYSNAKIGEHHLKLGTYFQIHKNLSVGAFYKLDRGLIHNEDWWLKSPGLSDGLPSSWEWKDSVNRNEHSLILDITPRFKFDIPDAKVFAEVKAQYEKHFSYSNDSVKIRPGVSWLVENADGEPVVTLYLQNEFYLQMPRAINFNQAPRNETNEVLPYENWLYLGAQFHISDNLSLGLSLAWRNVIWREGINWLSVWSTPSDLYTTRYNSIVIGVNAITRVKLL